MADRFIRPAEQSAAVPRMGPSLPGSRAVEKARKAFDGLMEPIWTERYLAERLEPLWEELGSMESRVWMLEPARRYGRAPRARATSE